MESTDVLREENIRARAPNYWGILFLTDVIFFFVFFFSTYDLVLLTVVANT
jgi:hypothetical protein